MTVDAEGSGNRSTRKPFGSPYSVTPSTDGPVKNGLGGLTRTSAAHSDCRSMTASQSEEERRICQPGAGDSRGNMHQSPSGT